MNSKEDAAKDCIKNGANVNYVNEVWVIFVNNIAYIK